MKTSNITKQELNSGLTNIRSAYRLLFEHQKRVLNTIGFIKDQFGMKADGGNKFFSDTIAGKRGDYPEVRTRSGMWAWDFLYSYCFEFYFGSKSISIDEIGYSYDLSIIQVSDTGFWESENDHKTELETQTFSDVKDSSSCFVFVFESKLENRDPYWTNKEKLGRELYVFLESKQNNKVLDTTDGQNVNSKFIMVRFDMSEFLDQNTTNHVIKQFNDFIIKSTTIDLLS